MVVGVGGEADQAEPMDVDNAEDAAGQSGRGDDEDRGDNDEQTELAARRAEAEAGIAALQEKKQATKVSQKKVDSVKVGRLHTRSRSSTNLIAFVFLQILALPGTCQTHCLFYRKASRACCREAIHIRSSIELCHEPWLVYCKIGPHHKQLCHRQQRCTGRVQATT